jgi:hypothetical protein
MDDLKRTLIVAWQLAFILGCGAGLLTVPALLIDWLFGAEIMDFLSHTKAGGFTLLGAGVLLAAFFIQEGQFSQWLPRYRRHEEKGH